MDKIQISETFPHKKEDLMDLILDAKNYTKISPYLKRIDVQDKGNNVQGLLAVIEVPVLPIPIHYGCDLENVPPNKIRAVGTQSPFKAIAGELEFTSLPNGHTKVDCAIQYDTGWSPVAMIAGGVMKAQIQTAVTAARGYLAQALPVVPDSPAAPSMPPPQTPPAP